jgi:hypothetical protein
MITYHQLHYCTNGFFQRTVKPVYKGHPRQAENVVFMNSCTLYTGQDYIHYSSLGKNEMVLYRQ